MLKTIRDACCSLLNGLQRSDGGGGLNPGKPGNRETGKPDKLLPATTSLISAFVRHSEPPGIEDLPDGFLGVLPDGRGHPLQ